MNNTHDVLSNGSRARLAILKAQSSAWWSRDARYRVQALIGATQYPMVCPGFDDSAPVLSAFNCDLPVRSGSIRFADKVCPRHITHKGWFTSDDCYATMRGFVASISHGRYLAGYYSSGNGEWVLYCDETYSDENDAAQAADEHARVIAEQEQEHNARFRSMVDAESLVEDQTTDVRNAITARNTTADNRQWARDAIERLRESRKELETATREYERT